MYQYKHGTLHFNQHDLFELVKEHGTPLYVYDLKWLAERYQHMRNALNPNVHIHYAVKANPHPQVLATLAKEGSHVDVVSAGEMQRCLEHGFKGSSVIFSGVAKTVRELKFALENGVGQINVESFPELERIVGIAKEMGLRAPVALRINPDVNPETHPYITTGFRDNKFGIEPERLYQIHDYMKLHMEQINFIGLSMHIGSQLLELDSMKQAVDKIIDYQKQLAYDGLPAQKLDLGGGLGIIYDRDDQATELKMLRSYANIINYAQETVGIDVLVEPGRWLVGHMGTLLTEVQYVKETEFKKFIIVDTGMHHLMRPALYQAHHDIRVVNPIQGNRQLYDIVGPICESSDVLGRDRALTPVSSGDILSIGATGAYGACLASRYNLHDWPKEIVI